MPRLYFGNFDVEHAWADGTYVRKPAIARLNAELASAFLGVARDGDVIWTPEAVEPGFTESLADAGLPSATFESGWRESRVSAGRFVPWGWSGEAERMAGGENVAIERPSPDAVRAVNRRSFGTQLEEEFGVGPDGGQTISAPSDLDDVFASLPHQDSPWVLKAEFGMSGRERHLGRGRPEHLGAHAWSRRRVERDGCVVFEPWLDVVDEVGIQFTIPRDGAPVLDGLVENLVDANGQYCGSRFDSPERLEREWATAVEIGQRAAERVGARGYHGPIGIDACRYRIGDELRLRPLQDLNARMTMGRIALGFRDRFESPGVWLHVRWPPASSADWIDRLQARVPDGVRLLCTSPFRVGGKPVSHGTVLVLGSDLDAVDWMMNLVRGRPEGTTNADASR